MCINTRRASTRNYTVSVSTCNILVVLFLKVHNGMWVVNVSPPPVTQALFAMLRTLYSFAPPLFIVCVVCNKCMHVLQIESSKLNIQNVLDNLVNVAIAKIWIIFTS